VCAGSWSIAQTTAAATRWRWCRSMARRLEAVGHRAALRVLGPRQARRRCAAGFQLERSGTDRRHGIPLISFLLPSSGRFLQPARGTLDFHPAAPPRGQAAGPRVFKLPPRYGCSAASAPPLIKRRDRSVLGQAGEHCRQRDTVSRLIRNPEAVSPCLSRCPASRSNCRPTSREISPPTCAPFFAAGPVPDLTSTFDINLNARVSLRRCAAALGWKPPDIAIRPGPAWQRSSGDHIPLGGFVLGNGLAMNIRLSKRLDDEHSAKPAGAEYWHIWTVRIPRRSIAGRLVWGRVWRRHDGYRWVYAHLDTPKSDLAR